MAADNGTLGSDWLGWGVRAGVVSVMAATGMVLAGQAAQATTTATESPGIQADGNGAGLPLDLVRVPDGNSGATCAGLGGVGGSGAGGVIDSNPSEAPASAPAPTSAATGRG